MAATTSGALKALIESQGLGVSAFRDSAPEGAALPYVSIREAISVALDLSGDFGSPTAQDTVTEVAQVDLWERLGTESYTLAAALERVLHGAVLSTSPTHAYGCRVTGSVRLVEQDTNIVHRAITVEIRRRH